MDARASWQWSSLINKYPPGSPSHASRPVLMLIQPLHSSPCNDLPPWWTAETFGEAARAVHGNRLLLLLAAPLTQSSQRGGLAPAPEPLLSHCGPPNPSTSSSPAADPRPRQGPCLFCQDSSRYSTLLRQDSRMFNPEQSNHTAANQPVRIYCSNARHMFCARNSDLP